MAAACGDYDVWRLMGNTGITLLIFEFGTHVNLQKVHLVLRRALKVTAVSTIAPIVPSTVRKSRSAASAPSSPSRFR